MHGEIQHITTLIAGCSKNDRNSQRVLYHWLHPYAMKICYRYAPQPEEAEELTSESFIKLFRNIGQFDAHRGGEIEALLKGWFKRIVVNTCIDHLRRSHLKFMSLDDGYENGLDAERTETGFDKMAYNDIIGAINKLSPVYRTVFNLFVIDGMSHEEIAAQLEISIGASKSNLSKARQNLRKLISQQTDYKAYV